jgi:hypothetical protein
MIDVLGPVDVVAPGGTKWTGSRVLKGIHLAQLGYPMVTLRLNDVQKAIEENSLKPFIADKLAPFIDKAKDRVSFKISATQEAQKLIDELLKSH